MKTGLLCSTYLLHNVPLHTSPCNFRVLLSLYPADPMLKFIKMESTHVCSYDFLQHSNDSTRIEFEISGGDRVYRAKGQKSPAIWFKENSLDGSTNKVSL